MKRLGMSIVLAVTIVPVSLRVAAAGESEKASFSGEAALSQALAGVKAMLEDPGNRQKMLDEKLRQAVSTMKIDEIRRLVAMGANPNASDSYNWSPLTTAVVSHGDPEVINVLLALGAKADLKGTCNNTALHYAASYGRLEAAQILIAHHADFDAKACLGETPLVEAVANGRTELVAYLMSLKADPNANDWQGKTPLMLALNIFTLPQRDDILALILGDKRTDVNRRDNDGMTALKQTVKNSSVEMVKKLLQVPGIDVNDNGGDVTALFLAELDHKDEIAQLLRAAGAKPLVASR
jgi:ankyrin repeat protein